MKKLAPIILVFVFLISCEKKDTEKLTGNITFSVNGSSMLKSTSAAISDAKQLVISIENESGASICEMKTVNLYKFNNEFISEPVALEPGNYKLTAFFVTDDADSVLYLTPLKGSELAYLVEGPLPINFSVSKDETTKVCVEIISASMGEPEDFGYVTFGFKIVNTIEFCIAAFEYVDDSMNFELTNASIDISSGGDTVYSGGIEAITNHIILPERDSYSVTVTKSGYRAFNADLALDSILSYDCTNGGTPLIVTLLKQSDGTIVFQPGPDDGTDALIWNLDPDVPRGDMLEFDACAWTYSGELTITRSLIKFNLSAFPSETEIKEAKLYLFGFLSPVNGASSSLTKPNYTLLCRITSPWEEQTVTWNNQPSLDLSDAILLDSCNVKTDYVIDVTEHVRTMAENPSGNYGWMLKLQEETYYRCMNFASSDNEDAAIRPKLVIKY